MVGKARDFGAERALIPVPPDEDCGPALRACTDMQRRFVTALLVIPDCTKESDAARIAGYSQPANDACQLMRNPKVLAAVREEADRRVRGGALIAAKALIEMAGDPMCRHRFQAAQALLDRAGLQVVTEHHVVVEDKRTDVELIEFIRTMAKKNGLDPRTLLGEDAIEGEFVEVSPTHQPPDSDELDFTIQPDEFA